MPRLTGINDEEGLNNGNDQRQDRSSVSDFCSVSTDSDITNYHLNSTTRARLNRSQSLRNPNNTPIHQTPQKRSTSIPEKIQPAPTNATRMASSSTAKNRRRKNTEPKKRKNRVLQEINVLQHQTTNILPRAPFARLVREIILSHNNDFRMTAESLECLQEASELYMTQFFEDANQCTIHRNRVTLIVKDIELIRRLRGVNDPGNF